MTLDNSERDVLKPVAATLRQALSGGYDPSLALKQWAIAYPPEPLISLAEKIAEMQRVLLPSTSILANIPTEIFTLALANIGRSNFGDMLASLGNPEAQPAVAGPAAGGVVGTGGRPFARFSLNDAWTLIQSIYFAIDFVDDPTRRHLLELAASIAIAAILIAGQEIRRNA